MKCLPLIFVVIVCFGIAVSSGCRCNAMNASKDDRRAWLLMYIGYAITALLIAIDVLTHYQRPVQESMTSAEMWALVCLALNLWLTSSSWGGGAPKIVKKDST